MRRCSVCGSEKSSLEKVTWKSRKTGEVKEKFCEHWYGTDEKPTCKNCFIRLRHNAKNLPPADTKCSRCGGNETLASKYGIKQWVRRDGGYLCWSCYITERNTGRVVSESERLKHSMRKPFRHTEETTAKFKLRVGDKNGFFGRQHTEETKLQISENRRGKLVGDKHPNWKNGISKLEHRIRTSIMYLKLRERVLDRDGYMCRRCEDVATEMHHIVAFYQILSKNNITTMEQALDCRELWDIDNCLSVCPRCHAILDSFRHPSS